MLSGVVVGSMCVRAPFRVRVLLFLVHLPAHWHGGVAIGGWGLVVPGVQRGCFRLH
jgi:hypothetical protein